MQNLNSYLSERMTIKKVINYSDLDFEQTKASYQYSLEETSATKPQIISMYFSPLSVI